MKPAGLFSDGQPLPAQFHNDQEFLLATGVDDPEVAWHAGYFGSRKIEGPVVG